VFVAAALAGQAAETRRGIKTGISFERLRICTGVVEQAPIFGNEEENEPVDQPEKGTIEVLLVQVALSELLTKRLVAGMTEETAAEGCNGGLHSGAQLVESARALLRSGLGPLFQPAFLGFFGFDA
jgi:hypothetical protein